MTTGADREIGASATTRIMRGVVLAALSSLSVLVAACGFHLRGTEAVSLPPELATLRLTMGGGAYPPLLVEVRDALLAQGGVQITDDVKASTPVLQILQESVANEVLATDSTGRVNAYLLNYRVDFSVTGADNKVLLERQSIRMQRELGFSRLSVLASEKQSEFLQTEMRRDAARQIVRRLADLRVQRKDDDRGHQP
jgi:LPS-assembly lipoprotein